MRLFTVAVLLVLAGYVSAEGVYRWQDEQGRWHFADKSTAPEASALFEPPPNQSWVAIEPVSAQPPLPELKPAASAPHPQLQERRRREQRCTRLRENMPKFGQNFKAHQERYDRECVLPWQR